MYLYIMSRPHSGSTILDILLGNSGAVESVGQLVSDMGELDKPCACGATIRDCPFWTEVRAGVEAEGFAWGEVVAETWAQSHLKSQPRTRLARADDARMARLAAMTRAIETSLTRAAGRPVLCDSTKEPTRALFLMRWVPEARFIHLVRDPRSAVASHYWRLKDRGFYHFLRRDWRLTRLTPVFLMIAALGWTVGNLLFLEIARRDPSRVLRVRYEDLRDRPNETLREIGRFLGLDLEPVIDKIARGEVLSAGHLIGGNDVRLEGAGLRFDPGREGTRRRLPGWVEAVTGVLCSPLMRRFGYGRGRGGPARPAPAA